MPEIEYSTERDGKYDFHRTPAAESWSRGYANPGFQINRVDQAIYHAKTANRNRVETAE